MRLRRQGPCWAVETPAKLNLSLEVLGRRRDGYHDLETVMVSVGLYDSLRFTPAPRQQLSLTTRIAVRPISGEPLPALSNTDDNLVLQAARKIRDVGGIESGVAIELVKRIPWQAGLGGGSSDAAATLVALNRMWNLRLTSGELHGLAAELGSDVNFFLDSDAAAVCRGRGEQTTPLPVHRQLHVVVAQPVGGLSTKDVFREWRPDPSKAQSSKAAAQRVAESLSQQDPRAISTPIVNDLETPAVALHAGVARLLDVLREEGRCGVGLSGSGSACFAVCRTRREATRLARRVSGSENCRVYVVSNRT